MPNTVRGGFRGTAQLFADSLNSQPLLIGAATVVVELRRRENRHPVVALFVELPTSEIDVNVHPQKLEVRFSDAADTIEIALCWRRDSLSPLIRNFLKCAENVVGRM